MAKIANKTVDGTVVRIEFVNGKSVEIDVDKLPTEIRARAIVHGIMQKLGDSYAGADGPSDGYDRCRAIADAITAGNWNQGRTATGGTLLVEALAKVAKRTVEEAAAVMDDDQRKAVSNHPDIKAAMAVIRAERAKADAKTKTAADLGTLFAKS